MLAVSIGASAADREVAAIAKLAQKMGSKQSLSKARLIRQAAYKHGLDARLLAAIIAQESSFRTNAVNRGSSDYGLTQINKHTIKAYGLDKARLMVDPAYAIDSGALILADFKRRYAAREPLTWVCRYNLGSKPMVGRRAELCLAYLNRVSKYYVTMVRQHGRALEL